MIRRPPRSTLSSSSAASDVYKRQPTTRDERRQNPMVAGVLAAAAARTPTDHTRRGSRLSGCQTSHGRSSRACGLGLPRAARLTITTRRATAGPPGSRAWRLNACTCLLYTSDAADEEDSVDLGGRR